MKSKGKKRLLALVLCMVVALSNSSFIFASETMEGEYPQEAEVQAESEAAEDVAAAYEEDVQPIAEEESIAVESEEEAPAAEEQPAEEINENEEPAAEKNVTPANKEEIADPEETVEEEISEEEETDPEETAEETVESEEAELTYEFKDSDGNVTETVTAKLPQGAFKADISEVMMEVEKLDVADAAYMQKLIEKNLPEDRALGDSVFYNITFKVDGEKADPEKMVEFSFKGNNLTVRESDETKVCYLVPATEEGQEDQMTDLISKKDLKESLEKEEKSSEDLTDYQYSEITFKADGKTTDQIWLKGTTSTVYGYYIDEKVPTLTYEDDNVVIKVSSVKEGAIPEGTSLQVTPIEKDSDSYTDVEKHLNDSAEEKTYSVAGFFAYDISLIDPDNNEIEPDGNVRVTMNYKNEVLPEEVSGDASSLDVTVVHLEENADGTEKQVVDMVADENEEASVETDSEAKVSRAEFITDSFSEYAIAWYANVSEALTTIETLDHTSAGITMRMIDMEGYPSDGYSIRKSGSNTTRFYFPNGGYGSGNIKKGLLNSVLADNGYPTTVNSSGSQNLKGLFGGGTTVNHLFSKTTYETTGYYEYSSFQNYAYLGTGTDFTVYNEIGTPFKSNSAYYYRRGNFMPYNNITATGIADYRERYDENGNNLGKDGRLLHTTQGTNNYYFGMYMGANFLQPKNGKVSAGQSNSTKKPMIYEFNGDDDMWIYIDKVLVLDIGGVHDAHSGYINFATGEVGWYDCTTNSKPKLGTTTLKAIFQKAGYFPDGTKWKNSKVDDYFTGDTFKDYTTHTFKMFYMERGAGASNLHMKFNLQVIPEGQIEVRKELSNTDKEKYSNVDFAFQVYAQKVKATDANGNETYYDNEYVLLNEAVDKATGQPITFTSEDFKDSNGKVTTYNSVFHRKPDQSAIFKGLKANRKYYVVEVGVNAQEYDKIIINGVTYTTFDDKEQVSGIITDVKTDEKTVEARPVVICTNNCSAYNSRELRITKKMKEGQTSTDTFSFKIQLSNDAAENQTLVPYANGNYYLKDADGNYWYYDNGQLKNNGEDAKVCGTTDANGIVTGVPVGYTVVVTQILSGTSFKVEEVHLDVENYLNPEKEIKAGTVGESEVADADGVILLGTDAEATITNSKPVNTLNIKKTDAANGNPLVGATFRIEKQNGETFEAILKDGKEWTVTTDAEGNATFGNLENGTYRVTETKAPDGYVLEENGNTFTVTLPYGVTDPADSTIQVKEDSGRNGKYLEVTKTVTNQRTTWEIIKVSESSKDLKLKDAEFELVSDTDANLAYYGKSAETTGKIHWYSDTERKKEISEDKISAGTYTLKETKAPKGYVLSTTTWKITLGQNGSWLRSEGPDADQITTADHTVTCYFENEVLYDLPSAGGSGVFTIMMSGILLMIAGVLILFKMRDKGVLER